ncbi:hypothetical protein BRETT_000521 [Brettanomyces bruxellensis]|uniref:20S-pre-rRNA D-site endonuclease NOB1 n=1 Tax=Dekkera bruxellensis TaxID=5007 RepID=A0A871R2A0_DEKBR|nr:uncharacterized protein BRETT_000521 [Brettanomyces bruxellensis]QOU20807.1 hypothetical protein BRETT_000521 [Brettanomyces bruxellensis]
MSNDSQKVDTLILDAGPLITQPAVRLQQLAFHFFTTPGVYHELRDENVRSKLPLWTDKLKVRQPRPSSIKAVSDFAKLTGDYAVLSMNDVHLLALTYELECDLNGGDGNLRKSPGAQRNKDLQTEKEQLSKEASKPIVSEKPEGTVLETKTENVVEEDRTPNLVPKQVESEPKSKEEAGDVSTISQKKESEGQVEDDGWTTVKSKKHVYKKKQRKRGGRKHKASRDMLIIDVPNESNSPASASSHVVQAVERTEKKSDTEETSANQTDSNIPGDDGEWITPENLNETILKDNNEVEDLGSAEESKVKAALATGDFAIQNVALQLGLNLFDAMSGLRIKRVRNYMYRCHACFTMVPMPKDGTPKHFCPNCGGATLMRCPVSVDSKTGEVKAYLKKNFQWHTRGNVYSLPSPLSKNSQKRYGRKGFQHRGNENIEEIYLREDQKEYQQAIKNAKWQRKQMEKAMENFVGGGSADNIVSPFLADGDLRSVKVSIGKGRNANTPRRRKR